MNQSTSPPAAPSSAGPCQFHSFTLAGAAVAAVTTFATLAVALPAWAMFLGWVGYSTSGKTLREGIANLISFLMGVIFGVGTGFLIGILTPSLGAAAVPVAVFGDVIVVLSLRALPPINNPLAYFLGLISFFASSRAPSVSTLAILAAAGAIGALGAAIASAIQSRVAPPAES